MGYSIEVDWSEARIGNEDSWEFKGRNLLEANCSHKNKEDSTATNMQYSGSCDKCGVSEDSGYPMMNYAYPLETKPTDGEILLVMEKTNCTVVFNSVEDKFYLALTGGGMDLSQDIARAYQIIENWVPKDLLDNVSAQPNLSLHGTEWLKMAKQIKSQIRIDRANLKYKYKIWNEAIKAYWSDGQ